MKLTMKEIDYCIEEIIDILCKIQEEELKSVLEQSYEVRLRQCELSCDEESEEEEDQGSDSGSDNNSFFETDSDLEDEVSTNCILGVSPV